jgi:hypothetical protein
MKAKAAPTLGEHVSNAIKFLNSTRIVKWISDQINNSSDAGTAKAIAQSKAQGTFDQTNQKYFDDAMKNLSTKQKTEVANSWLEKLPETKEIKELTQQIDALTKMSDEEYNKKVPSSNANAREIYITAKQDELETKQSSLQHKINIFKEDLQTTLKPNEVIIDLTQNGNPLSKHFDIIDMSKIDPTKSIPDQMAQLQKDNVVTIFDRNLLLGKNGGTVDQETLLNNYAKWVTKQFNFTPDINEPIKPLIESATEKITGHDWSEIDQLIRNQILKSLPQNIEDAITKRYEKTNQESLDATQAFEQFIKKHAISTLTREQIQNLTPEDIQVLTKEQIQALTPKNIQVLTKEQIQALTPDQADALTSKQLAVINIEYLKPEQIETLTADQISELDLNKLDLNFLSSTQLAALAPKISNENVIEALEKTLTGDKLEVFKQALIPYA